MKKPPQTPPRPQPTPLHRELASVHGGAVFEPNNEPVRSKYIGETEKN